MNVVRVKLNKDQFLFDMLFLKGDILYITTGGCGGFNQNKVFSKERDYIGTIKGEWFNFGDDVFICVESQYDNKEFMQKVLDHFNFNHLHDINQVRMVIAYCHKELTK